MRNFILENTYNYFFKKKFDTKYTLDKDIYHKIYHHSKNRLFKTSFGKKNKNKVFFVIKRTPGGGFFSNFIFILKWINFALKKKYIPVVDMKNFPTKYNEKNNIKNIKNVWEIYFDQISNYKLKDIYKSKNVIFCKERLNASLNDYKRLDLKKIYNNKIKIKKEILDSAKNFFKRNLKNKKKIRIIGIHFRGTDQKITPGHYLPPTIYDIKLLVDKRIRDNIPFKIFLVTEEKKYLEYLKKEYKNYVYYLPSFRADKVSDFNNSKRKFHRNRLGIESLKEALILSFCDEIIYCKSNIPLFSFLITKKRIIKTLINHGLNSYNPLFSFFKWRVIILPISFLKYLTYKIFLFS